MDEINSLESDPFFLKIFLEDFSLPLDEHGIKISQEFLLSGEEGITFAEIEKINILRNRLYQIRLSLNSSEPDPKILLLNACKSLKREMDLETSVQEEEDDQVKLWLNDYESLKREMDLERSAQKAELNVSLVTQPSIKLIADESEPPPQPIPAEDAKRDKVAEFEKFLKTINPYCNPDEAKIKKVLEEYKKYKELHSGEEDLKQAIDDALKPYTHTPPNPKTPIVKNININIERLLIFRS